MIASTFTDPVLGVDTHIMLVPTPAGPVPTPLPLPFTGIVLDPVGLALGQAMGSSMILINGLPATNCGTNVMNLPPHLPIPGPPAKGKLDNDALLMFGALNVEIGGSLAVRLGEIALSCSDPVRLPTSVVLAIPKGPLVLIPRPPVPDLKLIATTLAFKIAGKILKAVAKLVAKGLRALQRGILSKLFKGISNRLKFSPVKGSRFKQMWNDAVCFLTGHPVDVATGRVITSQTDLELFGPLPLTFSRRYDTSASDRPSSLGHGWSHPFDQAVWPERGAIVLRAEDGREIEFSTLGFPDRVIAPGREVYLPRERLTLRALAPLHFTVTDAQGTLREFARVPGGPDREARLIRIRDRLGQEQRFAYNPQGLLEQAIDPAGRRLYFHYDASGHLVRTDVIGTDGGAHLVGIYRYDPAGDLIEATDALGASYRYEYVEHLLVKETNKNGLSFYFQYDGVDSTAKCVRTWGDGGIYDHVITYDTAARRTLVENSLGNVTLYQMDEAGQVVSVTDAVGGVTQYEYDDESAQKSKEIAPDGAETLSEYDPRGNLIKSVAPDGAELALEYDSANQLIRAIDAIGGEWRWAYDGARRLIGRSNPLGERTQFHWDASRLVAVTDPLGHPTQLAYDAVGNLVTLTTPDASTTHWGYDPLGRTVATTDPNGNVQRRERDALGRVTRVAEPDGNQRELRYDPEGNVIRAVDRHYDVTFEYRGMNRLAARGQAGTRVEFVYDTEDQLIAIKNEHGFAYRFVLGATGNVDEEWGFDDLRRRYVRDAGARVTQVVRPEGKTTKYTYDKAGRVVAVLHSDGTKEAYAYRSDGAIVQAKNHSANVQFERDALGRITKELLGDDWVASEYDALGMRCAVRSSKGLSQRIRRNAMSDVLAIDVEVDGAPTENAKSGGADPSAIGPTRGSAGTTERGQGGAFSATFDRDRLGHELERNLPGGIRARWQRDALGRPVRQEIWRGAQFHTARQYTWDVNDRLKRVIDAMTGPVEYTHDALGNLAVAAYSDGDLDLRMPDSVGNLFRSQEREDRRYGRAGQLLEAHGAHGVTRYEYDPDGNLVRKLEPDGRIWTHEWNGAGMLVRVTRPDKQLVEFAYDAFGRRVSKKYRGKNTRWIWDGNAPLHEWIEREPSYEEAASTAMPTQAGAAAEFAQRTREAWLTVQPAQGPPSCTNLDERFLGTKEAPITWVFEQEGFAPIGKIAGGKQFAIITDHLGAPTAMFDGQGREVWGAQIDTYGDLRNLRGPREACPFRWPGQYEDAETGLYYNRFRYYDPDSGEYVSQDPIGLAGGLALHAYVPDTLTWIDPLGLNACSPKVIVLGEGMDRIKRAVRDLKKQGVDARWYQAWGKNFPRGRRMTPAEMDAALARNKRWLKQKLDDGYEIQDIGPDPNRTNRSPFYAMEKQVLSDAGYPVTPLPGY